MHSGNGDTRSPRRLAGRLIALLGGPARARVIAILAGVLALNSANAGTIGAVANQLENDLHINHGELGLLSGVSAGVGALISLPVGVLADRTIRVRVLVVTIAIWSASMLAAGLATSYLSLLLAQIALGAALAAAGPAVASLVGDLFPPTERARAYGWILSGELLGAGFGLLVGGDVAAALSWRYAFFLLALASLGLAAAVWRWMPEPRRGGTSWIPHDAPTIPLAGNDQPPAGDEPATGDHGDGRVTAIIGQAGITPVDTRVLRQPARELPLWRSVWYLLSIPTNRILIFASAVGYFFFAGLRTFVVIFIQRQFHISQTVLSGLVPIVGLGALTGVILGGRLTDTALRHGAIAARVTAPAIGFGAASLLFAPGLLSSTLWIAIPLFTAGAAALASANPPLDAARLDIVPGGLWGRAESVRTVLRLVAEAAAPPTFGFIADTLGGGTNRAAGLRDAFLIMLIPLLVNGALSLATRRTYPADVATAARCDR
ncbi:MFS transporter [Rugosimonospora africana]|uniref:MFS transporter n=1 Tax=Rugosimonospora africana TaxID=556532 RepID=A0A8J3R2Z6_9ACTN|nr:MFS transporter [Rugosimonospora africana]GIH20834.1 MFS transporter [Rugosimonospora africana]